jgi:hypothetical protein
MLTAALFGTVAATAPAQPDAGAKARGDMKGFWEPSVRRSTGPSLESRVARPVESYRSFSYAPLAIAPGDEVAVNVSEANLMLGRELVGTLHEGQKFKVTRVINGWLGAVVEEDGQTLKGWVWHRNVAPQERTVDEVPRTAAPAPAYRRFSYEPSQPMPMRSYRTFERTREPWQYQRTDPRKYQY